MYTFVYYCFLAYDTVTIGDLTVPNATMNTIYNQTVPLDVFGIGGVMGELSCDN